MFLKALITTLLVISTSPVCGARPKFPTDFRYDKDATSYSQLPKRSQLPTVPGNPKGSAWFWGPKDGLGRLNFLTPKRVRSSIKESKTGELVPLDLPVKLINPPFFNRIPFNHTHISFDGTGELPFWDEIFHMNTQTGTQWDSFQHFGEISTGIFYNNCTGPINPTPASLRCGIQTWAAHGIAARAHLLDFASYAAAHNIPHNPFRANHITLPHLHAVAHAQNLDLRPHPHGDIRIGDILLIRTGFVAAYQKLTQAERRALALAATQLPELSTPGGIGNIGLEPNERMAKFLHDSYFAAVAGDGPSLEVWPTTGDGPGGKTLHELLLVYWGVALGEFFDLERLARRCRANGRWTFFMTSAPFNVENGVSTWANAIAVL